MAKPAVTSLHRTMLLALAGIFVMGAITASIYFYVDTHNTRERLREQTMRAQAQAILDAYAVAAPGQLPRLSGDWRQAYDSPNSPYYYSVYDAVGGHVRSSRSLDGKAPLPLTNTPQHDAKFGALSLWGPHNFPLLAARIPQTGQILVVARSARDDDALAESLAEENLEPTLVLIPFGILAALAVILILSRTLKPLRRASSEAELVGPANPNARVSLIGMPSELRPLIVAFNAALDRLAEAYAVERRITENAAHELRTPLAILSARLQDSELTGKAMDWPAANQDVARMARLVSQLLMLARKEARAGTVEECEVSLSRVAREAAALMLPMAEKSDRTIVVDADEEVILPNGNEGDLCDLVRNLVENALAHGKGLVRVTVGHAIDNGLLAAKLVVEDEGDAIPEQLRSNLFERFAKASESSEGSGLGLAIVRQVAKAHGGGARFGDGSHMAVEVWLPI